MELKMDTDIKTMSLLLDIDHYEHLLIDNEAALSEHIRKREEYKKKLDELRHELRKISSTQRTRR